MAAPAVDASRLVEAAFREHYEALCRWAYLLLGDPGLAEELVMDVFAGLLRNVTGLRDPAAIGGYLRQGVVNRVRSRRSGGWREQQTLLRLRGRRTQVDVADPAGQYGEEQRVLAAVGRLPLRQRIAIVLRYYADLTEPEIAAALGCATGTVKSQLSRARSTLARDLGDTA